MSYTRLVNTLLLALFSSSSFAQEYSYTHYDITEGLAGSIVYCITQDKDGFIWVGTETGVSRFDGTHFINFTTTDGLDAGQSFRSVESIAAKCLPGHLCDGFR
jgi:ligand-binding sensor domain-containing protein